MNFDFIFRYRLKNTKHAASALYAILLIIGGSFMMGAVSPLLGTEALSCMSTHGYSPLVVRWGIFMFSASSIFVGLYQLRLFSSKQMLLMRIFYTVFTLLYIMGSLMGFIPILGKFIQTLVHLTAFLAQLIAVSFLISSNVAKGKGRFAATIWLFSVLFKIILVIAYNLGFELIDSHMHLLLSTFVYLVLSALYLTGMMEKQRVVLRLKQTRSFLLLSLFSISFYFLLIENFSTIAPQKFLLVNNWEYSLSLHFINAFYCFLLLLLTFRLKSYFRAAFAVMLAGFIIVRLCPHLPIAHPHLLVIISTYSSYLFFMITGLILLLSRHHGKRFRLGLGVWIVVEIMHVFLTWGIRHFATIDHMRMPFYDIAYTLFFVLGITRFWAWRKIAFSFLIQTKR